MPDPKTPDPSDGAPLNDALRDVLVPLARLAVERGVPFAVVEELLKQAFVDAARNVHGAGAQPHRMVSRIATATGLTRREVTRLTQPAETAAKAAPRRSLASEVFARWMSDPAYRSRKGPKALPRIGDAPSFEALAQSVTRDVHPRSLLDELIRLGLAAHDETSDRVTLVREAFVPRGDVQRMMGLLGANVGDHLAGAVDNVLGDGSRHFEQALFADGLPPDAMSRLREIVLAQWKDLRASIVPTLEEMIDAERAAGREGGARVRIGLYTYTDAPASEPAAPPKVRPRRIRSRE
jgi:hypothetical protein